MRGLRTGAGSFALILALAASPVHAGPAAPLNYFLHAAGPAAAPTQRLGWVLSAIAILVTLIIAGLLVGAIVRRRPAPPTRPFNAEAGGMHWIYIGTGVSSIVLLAILVYVLITLESVASPAAHPQLTLTVTAYDWWWKVDYADDPDPLRNFSTANEIHIPVGQPVKILLKSADVVHAFWVPQLAGKTQTIPGQTNEQWIQADQPGIFRGQCSQFCGAQHAHMAFEVVAQSPADFAAWRAAQGRTAGGSAGDAAVAAGRHLFAERCAGCHTIRGSDAAGLQAPDLTHLLSRRTLAAGALTNTPEHLLDWIEHAQRIKPEALMPDIPLTTGDAAALSAYLATLH
ncbi:cytochrome c oxidase subunit II [Paraburkholderia xenovorans]|uniref:Cytochrome aa3 subunit 2 n=1 Tax=Paraburkholderia xenovorans (strain LB400) TaxID=266265 RepID=Q13IT4_PARXL|nr:cytochrome c oxidase subunit II [Paraburkholderia xenovorans]ABE36005.1 Putative cytochrome c oxidase subunit II [Paraburkholderia xenovorans LB400]